MHDVESQCHWHNKCRSKDLVRRVMHYITTSLLCNADAKWRGHHCRLVADMADDVRHVCTCANQELSLPLKTDHFNKACSTFVLQADNLGCCKCSTAPSPISLKSGTLSPQQMPSARQGDYGLIGTGIRIISCFYQCVQINYVLFSVA